MNRVIRNEEGEFLGYKTCDDKCMSRQDYADMARMEDEDYDDCE